MSLLRRLSGVSGLHRRFVSMVSTTPQTLINRDTIASATIDGNVITLEQNLMAPHGMYMHGVSLRCHKIQFSSTDAAQTWFDSFKVEGGLSTAEGVYANKHFFYVK